MTLYCDLYEDGKHIGTVRARQVADAAIGDVNAFDCLVAGELGGPVWCGRIWHGETDSGAWELVERVLRASRSPLQPEQMQEVP